MTSQTNIPAAAATLAQLNSVATALVNAASPQVSLSVSIGVTPVAGAAGSAPVTVTITSPSPQLLADITGALQTQQTALHTTLTSYGVTANAAPV
jgi:hypothetical protein